MVRLEGFVNLKKKLNYLIGTRTRDHLRYRVPEELYNFES
jgi:hypothetical protein